MTDQQRIDQAALDQADVDDDTYFLRSYAGRRPEAPAWFGQALARAPERSHFISDGTKIELLTWGERGKPGLLFLHGNGAHADWWSFVAPYFADDWRCAALSYSGMGGSGIRPEGSSFADLAQEARDTVRAAGLDEGPVAPVVIGHSMGGSVGMEAASTPGLFRALVLIDSALDVDPEMIRKARIHVGRRKSEHRRFASLEDGLARFRLSPPQPCINDYIGDYIARRSLTEVEDGWVWRFDPRGIRASANEPGPRGALSCPVAYIHGDRSALATGSMLARSLAALPDDIPVIGIPDAAHHVPIDQPLALVSALRTLLSVWPGA